MTGHGAKFGRKQEEAIAALLSHRGIEEAARAIESAVATAIETGRATKDVGGDLGTAATGEAVVEILGKAV